MVKRLTDWLVYFLVRVVVCVVQALPLETCQSFAHGLAWIACDGVRLRRRVVDDNLKQVFPELDEQARHAMALRMWQHLFLMVCEIAHVPRKLHETNWRKYVTFPNKRDLMRLLLDPRPTVLVSGHFGNFEIASYLAGLFGIRTYAVARTLDNPYLNRFVNQFRESKGQYILPKDGSANQIADHLVAGDTLSILGDQAAGPKGCWVDFLGRPASCHKAVALFTLVSGAPMVVMSCARRGGPLEFEMTVEGFADPQCLPEELASVSGLTQWYNQRLGQAIRRWPEQYWWVHRRWKDVPPQRKLKVPNSARPAA